MEAFVFGEALRDGSGAFCAADLAAALGPGGDVGIVASRRGSEGVEREDGEAQRLTGGSATTAGV